MSKRGKKKKKGRGSGSSSVEQELIRYIKGSPQKEFTRKALYKKFLRKSSKEEIAKALERLESRGKINLTHNRVTMSRGRKSNSGRLVEGVVDMTSSGYGFVISEQTEQDIFVNARKLNKALDGDRVKVQITKVRKGGKMEGEVVDILKRAQSMFMGTVHLSDNFAFLIADRRNMVHDIFIPLQNLNKAKDGEKAVAEITEWPTDSKSPVGKIVEVLGKAGENEVEMKSILLENGFPLTFSKEAMKQAEAVSETITEQDIEGRRDFRNILTFTIDPDDAKDFDDALSFEKLKNGNYEVGIHIADVSHYVKPGSPLDKDAYDRATSVYLVDRVLPMLPEKLSNKVCSLRPEEEKLTFSTVFELDQNAKVKSVWYGKSIINSDKRFTYQIAQDTIESGKGEQAEALRTVNDLAIKLRTERIKKGSIPFESVEIKIIMDENNKPVDIVEKKVLGTNKLIEDYMLLANKYVATYFSKLKSGKRQIPGVYRVHDKPDMFKLEIFSMFARNFGYQINISEPAEAADQLNRLLDQVRGKKEQNVLEQLAIRSMAKAEYTTNNIGHFGLAFEHYTHFTSPIRRYPDVLVHRILEDHLNEGEGIYMKDELEQLCAHSSTRERSAMVAERESKKYKQVEFMQDKVGQEFDGIISGVIYKGLFIELVENKCEGFIPVRDLGTDEYSFDEAKYTLTNMNDGTSYRLGEEIKVIVAAVNLENRTIDLEPAE